MTLKAALRKTLLFDKLSIQHRQLSYSINDVLQTQTELLDAMRFHDTICNYEWLRYKGISPGGWAANYGLCYTLARVLNNMKPSKIIECGLGQSSRLIHQYASYYKAQAITCEHDDEWISFLMNEINNAYPITIKRMEIEEIEFCGERTITYKDIRRSFPDDKFNLLLIDGPYGTDHYSRPQAITLAEHNLDSSFCIIMDDTDRFGEQQTVDMICETLKANHVNHLMKQYGATKKHTIICSPDLKFLTSL